VADRTHQNVAQSRQAPRKLLAGRLVFTPDADGGTTFTPEGPLEAVGPGRQGARTMSESRWHLGFLYPGYSAEDDYPRIETLIDPPAQMSVVHTSIGEDAHREDALLDVGSEWRLHEGARELKRRGVHSAMWACTSGSFVFGVDGARRQVKAVEDFLGVPVSSTSLAFVEAARALGVRRVSGQGIITAVEVATLGRDEVLALATANDHEDAEVVLLPDTALRTVAWLEALENVCGKPVLTANQVTVWQALRLAGHPTKQRGLGRLFL
jgi:maleate cis-trans isomerase